MSRRGVERLLNPDPPPCPLASEMRWCPLYVESHNPRELGCIDDLAEPCVVQRDRDPARKGAEMLGRLLAVDARLVAQCRWAEEQAERKAQRARNLRAAGLQ